MSKGLLKLGVLGLSALTFTLVLTAANHQERVRWKMQSAFGSQLPHLGPSGVRFSKDIERMSGGKFEVKFYEPGALIPPLECFDAVSKGSIESCWTTPGYHTGKYPALAFFTTVPFGPGFGEFLAWKWFGGGNELRAEIYAKHNLIAVDCFCIGPETSGWFRSEIKSIEELKGLKMRFFGLGAQVMQKLGVSTSCWPRPTSTRRWSAASPTPPSSRCPPWTSSWASTRSPSSTTSPAGTSSSPAASS